jgi:hypothetical protein
LKRYATRDLDVNGAIAAFRSFVELEQQRQGLEEFFRL